MPLARHPRLWVGPAHHLRAWSYLLKLRVAGLAELEAFVAQELRRKAGVERTETILALATVKETAILPVAPSDDEEA